MLGKDDTYVPNFLPDEFMRVLLTRVLREFGDQTDYSNRNKYSNEALARVFDLIKENEATRQGKFVLSQENLRKIILGFVKNNQYIGIIGRKEKKFLLLLCRGPQSAEALCRKLSQKNSVSLRNMKSKLQKKIIDRDKRHMTGITRIKFDNGKLGYQLTIDPIKFGKIFEKEPRLYKYLKYEHGITG